MKEGKKLIANSVRSVKLSWSIVWQANGPLVIVYLALELVTATLPLFQVYYLKLLIDFLMARELENTIGTVFLWAASIILSQILGAADSYLKTRMDKPSSRQYDEIIYEKMAKLPLGIFDTAQGRDMCDLAACCGLTVYDEIPFGMFIVMKEAYTFAVSIVILFHFNVPFVLLYLLFTIPGIIMDYVLDEKTEQFRFQRTGYLSSSITCLKIRRRS